MSSLNLLSTGDFVLHENSEPPKKVTALPIVVSRNQSSNGPTDHMVDISLS